TVLKLEQAFGKDCEEAKPKRPIKIEVPARGMVLSAGDFKIEDDGRVRLWPLSVALFGKARGEDGTPEINTIRGDVAYITFERPIQTLSDMGKHRITAGQIAGSIRVVNNRRSAGRDDDLSVYIGSGPLDYRQKDQRIGTDDYVRLVDSSSRPRPTVISGQGMVLDLIAEAPAGRPGQPRPRKQQFDTITGVKRVRLLSAVAMDLFMDSRSGFLNSRPPAARPEPAGGTKTAAGPGGEKTHLVIKTHGPFSYDLRKDFARFDVPPRRGDRTPHLPEFVEVVRVHEAVGKQTEKLDHLNCEHL